MKRAKFKKIAISSILWFGIILCLNKIFYICRSKVTSQTKKKPRRISPEKVKQANKTTECVLLTEQKPTVISSKKVLQKPSEKEELTTDTLQKTSAFSVTVIDRGLKAKYYIEKAEAARKIMQKEQKEKSKIQKPYKKKAPLEETKGKIVKEPTTEGDTPTLQQRKTIYLGNTQRRAKRSTRTQQKYPSDENVKREKFGKAPQEKEEYVTTVESPFVELDVDSAEIYIVLPKQQIKANTINRALFQVNYILNLNGKQKEVSAEIITKSGGLMFVEEKRILLEAPLVKFQVIFPDELQGRKYIYSHQDTELYAFVAIGNNRGRMHYLYNNFSIKNGNINALPKRNVWILLDEEFELQTEPDVIEERWIWGKYQPFLIDFSKIDDLVINNRISGKKKVFASQATFRVEGEPLVEDDYKKECPLFKGKTLKIIAPYENHSGWRVWIQNKEAGYKIKENWTGREPLILNCPEDLPCDCGEFQVDICQEGTRISDETLFFRLIPSIDLIYPKELIIPNIESGHTPSTVKVKLDDDSKWELKFKENKKSKVKMPQHNFYKIELPPEEDILQFSLSQTNRSETSVKLQLTIPRLKWKTSKQKIWGSMLQNIERSELKSGEPFHLLIQTNDFRNKYEIYAFLEANGQKLQEGKFICKGMAYVLELNQFYDTIKQNNNETNLKVKIKKKKNNRLIGEVHVLKFAPSTIRCKHIDCNFKTHSREKMESHLEKYHLRDLVESLSYEEIREYYKSLPKKIYKCNYCKYYSREDDPRNPTSVIIRHIENECPGIDHGKVPPKIHFQLVADIDEIRQNVLPELPHIYKCKICGLHFKDYSKNAKVKHFFEKHENKIVEYLER